MFLNGSIIGYTEDEDETVDHIRELRLKGELDKEVSVTYDPIDNMIKIFSDEGRLTRPLFTLNNNKLNLEKGKKYKWNSLIKRGIIQYLDSSEIENCVIAMDQRILATQKSDYCEIHPIVMLGIMASLIPFPDHSQSPRNCYQSSMGKQALGIPLYTHRIRTDTLLHVLHYPQKPLVKTKVADFLNIDEMPSGVNAIVAIAAYTGFN